MMVQKAGGALDTVARLYTQSSQERAEQKRAARRIQLMQDEPSAKALAASADSVSLSAQAYRYLGTQTQAADTQMQAAKEQASANSASEAVSNAQAADGQTQADAAAKALSDAQAEAASLRAQAEAANEQAKAAAEELEQKLKCLKIMGNLISGKRVPGQDQRYLAEHDSNMYAKAITLRAASKLNQQKAKRVTEDADFESQQDAADAPQPENDPAENTAATAPADGASGDGEAQA